VWCCGLEFKISRTLILVGLLDCGLVRSIVTESGEFKFSLNFSCASVDYSVPELVNLSLTNEFFI